MPEAVQATKTRKSLCAQRFLLKGARQRPCLQSIQQSDPILVFMRCQDYICRFQNSRGWCCAAYNEVAIDYNAAFTGAIARLVDFYDGMKPFSDCTLELGWSHPNASLVRLHPRCCHHCLLSPAY